ncbi:Uncharacterised protein [Burkholderia pseudomallei]|uniref:hypothetical protein n=1 Tax=Burkholderia pseudomallei TaxID=28450 RepID=UPI0004F6C2DF|nr:hypothetical protein [Burkholderia pseudomallei]AIO14946.1 hypothetical protein DP58_288 [Burkholderia pseudomallei]AIO89448.1 hypothetical protein DP48_2180 [Burkholderia pseudomallei]KGC76240.1 hypothetical protein DP61_2864 [Burkholderia pseudomallei]MCD4552829.1 hypothetical protein [Burkholderia pseudomallei]MCV9976379.1 hypothetical protein [Burkholderia pseudomallei]
MTLRAPAGTRKALQAVDSSSESGEPRGRKRKVRLANAKDVRRELAYVYRALANGEEDLVTAKGKAYILGQMRDAIVADELEEQADIIERRQKKDPL